MKRFALLFARLCALVLIPFLTSARTEAAQGNPPPTFLHFMDLRSMETTRLVPTSTGLSLIWKDVAVTDLLVTFVPPSASTATKSAASQLRLEFRGMFDAEGVAQLSGSVQPSGNGNWSVVINDHRVGGYDFLLNSAGTMLSPGECLCPVVTGNICISQDCTDGNQCTYGDGPQHICKRQKMRLVQLQQTK